MASFCGWQKLTRRLAIYCAEDLEAKVGRIDRFTSVADVVDRFETNKHGVGPRVSWSNGFTKNNGGTDYIELASSSPKEKEGIGV